MGREGGNFQRSNKGCRGSAIREENKTWDVHFVFISPDPEREAAVGDWVSRLIVWTFQGAGCDEAVVR